MMKKQLMGMVLLLGCTAGCIPTAQRMEQAWNVLIGKQSVDVRPKTPPKPAVSENSPGNSEAARRAKANTELLAEMYRVIFGAEVKLGADFRGLVDTLNQGASLEGVYNGIVHSSTYRNYEIRFPGVSAKALQTFSEELAKLTLELQFPSEFNSKSAAPLARPVDPGQPEDLEIPERLVFGKPTEGAKPNLMVARTGGHYPSLVEQYKRTFEKSSLYTLKRVLGDEALKVIAAKKTSRNDLAKWYARLVLQQADRGVDFGLEMRNRKDEAFHFNWALAVSEDQIMWEVLNRLLRMMNQVAE